MEQNYVTDVFTSDLVKRALAFAAKAHESVNQRRKYTNEPYITHPVTVAGIVASVGGSKVMVAAALLHDVVEDVLFPNALKIGFSPENARRLALAELEAEFGSDVTILVDWLSDVSKPSDGNRVVRKALDRQHSAQAPDDAQTIKLADLIDNTMSIVKHDRDFAKVYMEEKRALLEVMTNGDPRLYVQASELVRDYFQNNL